MRKVDFVFFDAGGGHRAAATALRAVVEQQGRDWDVRLVNLQEVLDAMDIFLKYTGIRMQDVYNRMLAGGWTLGSAYLVPFMHGLIRLYEPKQVRMLAEFWSGARPDLVVSVVPNFNRALLQGLRRAHPGVPFVTILTDLADYPPHFWIEKQDQHYICGTEKALDQARRISPAPEKAIQVSGMILRPGFYQEFTHDRAAERFRLGLAPDKPTAIVLFGGQGSSVMVRIVEQLRAASLDLQLILVCGRNDKLRDRLAAMKSRVPLHLVGFTDQVPYYMSLSDFFIGKPGPGSISEALAMRLPVIIERNAWTLPQERYNTEWVREKGVGIVLPSFREIRTAVEQMLKPEILGRYRANAAAIHNRAVFEIPEILERIMG